MLTSSCSLGRDVMPPCVSPHLLANLHAMLCPSQRNAHCTRRQRFVVVSARRHCTIRCAHSLSIPSRLNSHVSLIGRGVTPGTPSPSSFPRLPQNIIRCIVHAGDVVTLTDDNFDQQLAAHSTEPWFIAIGAPWCPRKRLVDGA